MRLIDANAFSDLIESYGVQRGGIVAGDILIQDVLDFVEDAPIIEAELVVHAHWVPVRGRWDGVKNYKCSLCGQLGGGKYANLLPRCPHCGAKMDEEAV